MSGSAALASARRRRAGPSSAPPPQPRQVKRSNIPPTPPAPVSTSVREASKTNPQAKISPVALVAKHNSMIIEMQEEMKNMRRELDTYRELHNTVNELKDQLDSDLNINNIAFFKEKYDGIRKNLDDIKRLVVKVQTFSMETNLSVIELKKNQKMETESLEKNESRSEYMINVLTDVSDETQKPMESSNEKVKESNK